MIFELYEKEETTLKNLNEIKDICDGILRRFNNGSIKFLIEDITDIKTFCDFIAEDNFNRKPEEY